MGLSNREIAYFHDSSRMISCKKGTTLFLENNHADFFYVICSGWIKLFHALPEDKEAIVDILSTGKLVGARYIFERGLYITSAQVAEDAELMRLPISFLENQIRLNSDLALSILSFLSQLQQRQRSEISLSSIRRAPQRVGAFLLRLCPESKENDIVFHLPSDKTLITQTLGISAGNYSRALNTLMDSTPVRIIGTRVEIDSVKKLAKFAYGKFAEKYLADNYSSRRLCH